MAYRATLRPSLGWPLAITAAVVASAVFATEPVRNKVTLRPEPVVGLARPPAYTVVAPFSNILDSLSLLSVPQHLALLAGAALVFFAARITMARGGGRRASARFAGGRVAVREARVLLRALGIVFCAYGLAALAPRPMARLVVADPDLVAVDFHSHSGESRDVRADWSPSRNREWHRRAGFHVAYVTDHRTFDGASAAARENPPRAGAGVSLLSGIELHFRNSTVTVLGVNDSTFLRIFVDPRRSRSPAAPRLPDLEPIRIQTVPEYLSNVPPPDGAGRNGVLAIEISDGAPRGITQTQRDRGLILRLADSLDLALVSGSNHHGWGRCATAWSLVRIPGWRVMPPDSVGRRIEQLIRDDRHEAVTVVERTSPDAGRSPVALAATAPVVAWQMFTTLSLPERLSWLAWTWLFALLTYWRGVRRAR